MAGCQKVKKKYFLVKSNSLYYLLELYDNYKFILPKSYPLYLYPFHFMIFQTVQYY